MLSRSTTIGSLFDMKMQLVIWIDSQVRVLNVCGISQMDHCLPLGVSDVTAIISPNHQVEIIENSYKIIKSLVNA
ncbi:hypothetical protein AXFE_07580 [Acidithrix ferrooxidans]|uniref:Uncharacterized protein n=1 Tax=Acidithrix ferrooxidans TaxID=1280514 RepID=A0A0D8HK94_9ACTN|nr:hypothetical protein AXFE_07580 [Acidithrix ferrooxidans]